MPMTTFADTHTTTQVAAHAVTLGMPAGVAQRGRGVDVPVNPHSLAVRWKR